MADQDDLETKIATTLAPMLLTISVFSLTVMGAVPQPASTIVDEILAVIAGFCIFTSALMIDSILDKLQLTLFGRAAFLNGGYLVFCVVVGVMTACVPILYAAKRAGNTPFSFDASFLIFMGAGVSVFLKLMTLNDRNVWVASMFVFFVFTAYVLAK